MSATQRKYEVQKWKRHSMIILSLNKYIQRVQQMHDTDLWADYSLVLHGLLRELQLLCVSEIGSFLNLISNVLLKRGFEIVSYAQHILPQRLSFTRTCHLCYIHLQINQIKLKSWCTSNILMKNTLKLTRIEQSQ